MNDCVAKLHKNTPGAVVDGLLELREWGVSMSDLRALPHDAASFSLGVTYGGGGMGEADPWSITWRSEMFPNCTDSDIADLIGW
ncbi:MAG: hypothetical protein RSB25_15925 [Acinetobacter sp.]